MKTPLSFTLKCAALVTLLCSGALVRGSDNAMPASKGAPAMKAVFVDAADSGKDPFFPTSTRRLETFTRATTTNIVAPSNALFSQIALKGISGTKSQPLALINGATVTVGELAEIKCGQQVVKVRCREIRERSVLVELEGRGEIRELKLRDI
jgi:hypothetical protein